MYICVFVGVDLYLFMYLHVYRCLHMCVCVLCEDVDTSSKDCALGSDDGHVLPSAEPTELSSAILHRQPDARSEGRLWDTPTGAPTSFLSCDGRPFLQEEIREGREGVKRLVKRLLPPRNSAFDPLFLPLTHATHTIHAHAS